MPETAETTETTETTAADAFTETAATQETTQAAVTETAAAAWDGKIESLDAGVQKIITDLRKEAGDNRVAKNAETERVNAILKAAGIKTDAPDPAELLAQSQTESAAAKRELAVFKAAATAGADPTKLLDRASFLTSIAGIDPADGLAIAAAIKAAVGADSTLKAVRAAGASGTELSGSGETGQITEAQLAQMTPEQISKALKEGKLAHLL